MRLRIATTLLALGALVGTLLVAWPAVAAAKLVTRVTVFQAYTATGATTFKTRTVSGYCWTGSIAADRKDAWRCFVGNTIHDPCFSSPQDPGYVACPNPRLTRGIKIKLTKKLPHKFANHSQPSAAARPWLIQTASRRRWEFVTGATRVVDGRAADYFSRGSRAALWGLPIRRAQPWRIYWAPLNATSLHKKVSIRRAWT